MLGNVQVVHVEIDLRISQMAFSNTPTLEGIQDSKLTSIYFAKDAIKYFLQIQFNYILNLFMSTFGIRIYKLTQ